MDEKKKERREIEEKEREISRRKKERVSGEIVLSRRGRTSVGENVWTTLNSVLERKKEKRRERERERERRREREKKRKIERKRKK